MGMYLMSKVGLDMFTKVTALELGPKGIRVNSIKYLFKNIKQLIILIIDQQFRTRANLVAL